MMVVKPLHAIPHCVSLHQTLGPPSDTENKTRSTEQAEVRAQTYNQTMSMTHVQ